MTCASSNGNTTPGDPVQANLAALATQAHVWLADTGVVSGAERLARCEGMLSAEEMMRYRRYRFASDRFSFLLSHALVRCVLSRYGELPPSAWRFSTGVHGKPEIHAPELPVRLRFNLSHTRGLAACLVVRDDDCGIDVELLSRPCDIRGIAGRMFSQDELASLRRLEGDPLRRRFFALWTLREAYGKALGQGLAVRAGDFGFELNAAGTATLQHRAGTEPGDWQFSLLQPTQRHLLALAVRAGLHPQRRIVSRWLDPVTAATETGFPAG